jgi:hypothetical protein
LRSANAVRVSFEKSFRKSGLKAAFPKLSLRAFWKRLKIVNNIYDIDKHYEYYGFYNGIENRAPQRFAQHPAVYDILAGRISKPQVCSPAKMRVEWSVGGAVPGLAFVLAAGRLMWMDNSGASGRSGFNIC